MPLLLRIALSFFWLGATTSSGHAATFAVEAGRIELSGPFVAGDTSRLAAFLRTNWKDRDSQPELSLNSPGGSLAEGIQMGRFLRRNSISTVVRRGRECHSACAVAFLGGTQAYATGSGIGRYLEVGAALGFHGFSSGNNSVVLLNEAFDAARVINGVIVQYASEMRGIDLALLSELVAVEPRSIHVVKTPREIQGLGITLRGALPPRPGTWAINACGRHVSALRPVNDGPLESRISSQSERRVFLSLDQFLNDLLITFFPEARRADLSRWPRKDLIGLVAESSPKPPIHRIELRRGAGLYFDYCYAFDSEHASGSVHTLLIDEIAGMSKSIQSHGPLGWYPDRAALW